MYKNNSEPFLIERIVAAFSYITMGFVGFIWLILGLFTKARLRPFMQYHIFQSIFLSIGFVLLYYIVGFISNILSIIPFINKLVAQIIFLLNMPLIFDYSLIQTVVYVFMFYLAITAFMGKYSYVPYVSEIIDENIRR
ncbi:MAG: hypothetical protein ACLSWI_03630 [Candidatus Gastranaerophilaceae bacterium]